MTIMEKIIYRCYLFSPEQDKFLRDKSYGIDRMECFMTLAELAVHEDTKVRISEHKDITLTKGQFTISDVKLSQLWRLERKTVHKIMKRMEELGIFSSAKVGQICVYSMKALSGWHINGQFCWNPFYRKPARPMTDSTMGDSGK